MKTTKTTKPGTVAEAVEQMLPHTTNVLSIAIEFHFPAGSGVKLDRAELHQVVNAAVLAITAIGKDKKLTTGTVTLKLWRGRKPREKKQPEASDQTAGYIAAIKEGKP